jgi:glycosyltransferase involved in cell wall biosynthesis
MDQGAESHPRPGVTDQRLVLYSSLAFFPTHWETFKRLCRDYHVDGTAFAAKTADLPDVHRQAGWAYSGQALSGISVRPMPAGSRLQRVLALRRALADLRPDAIWVQQEPTDQLALELLAAMRTSRGPRILCAVCENQFDRTNSVVKLAGRLLWPRIDALAAVATASLDGIRAIGMPISIPSAVLVAGALSPPTHLAPASLPFEVVQSDFVVGFAGRIVPEKGWRDVVAAVAELPRSFKLVMAGSNEEPDALNASMSQPNLRDRAAYVGLLNREELWRFYASLDCLVLPSRTTPGWKEQFGGVLADAMAVGLPIIGSSSGAIPEVIGSAGLIFPEGDVGSLAGCLERLANEPLLRGDIAAQGRSRFVHEFEITAYARKLAALLGLRPRMQETQEAGAASV